MIFYNGFNLMIDLIIISVAVYAVRRAWLQGYGAGQTDMEKFYGVDIMEYAIADYLSEVEDNDDYSSDETIVRKVLSAYREGQKK